MPVSRNRNRSYCSWNTCDKSLLSSRAYCFYVRLWLGSRNVELVYLGNSKSVFYYTRVDAGAWSLDNYGERLIATIKNGSTFEWDPTAGTGVNTRAALVPNNPTATVLTRVSDRDRHLIHFGTETTIGTPCYI
jgi:hypothetical protein